MTKKRLIDKKLTYIENIGKTLCVEKFNDGTEFYCLLDKAGNFNIIDTGKSFDEIKERIEVWEDLIKRNVIEIR